MKVDPNLINRSGGRNRITAFVLIGVVVVTVPFSWFVCALGIKVVSAGLAAAAVILITVVSVLVYRGFSLLQRQICVLLQVIRLHGGEEALGALGRLLDPDEPDVQRALLSELLTED